MGFSLPFLSEGLLPLECAGAPFRRFQSLLGNVRERWGTPDTPETCPENDAKSVDVRKSSRLLSVHEILVALAAEAIRPRKMTTRRKNRSEQVQLQLSFPDPSQNDRKLPADSEFPDLSEIFIPMTDDDLARDFDKKFPL